MYIGVRDRLYSVLLGFRASENWGDPFGVPNGEDYSFLRFALGCPMYGNYHSGLLDFVLLRKEVEPFALCQP